MRQAKIAWGFREEQWGQCFVLDLGEFFPTCLSAALVADRHYFVLVAGEESFKELRPARSFLLSISPTGLSVFPGSFLRQTSAPVMECGFFADVGCQRSYRQMERTVHTPFPGMSRRSKRTRSTFL